MQTKKEESYLEQDLNPYFCHSGACVLMIKLYMHPDGINLHMSICVCDISSGEVSATHYICPPGVVSRVYRITNIQVAHLQYIHRDGWTLSSSTESWSWHQCSGGDAFVNEKKHCSYIARLELILWRFGASILTIRQPMLLDEINLPSLACVCGISSREISAPYYTFSHWPSYNTFKFLFVTASYIPWVYPLHAPVA